jgi:hypothetical protein
MVNTIRFGDVHLTRLKHGPVRSSSGANLEETTPLWKLKDIVSRYASLGFNFSDNRDDELTFYTSSNSSARRLAALFRFCRRFVPDPMGIQIRVDLKTHTIKQYGKPVPKRLTRQLTQKRST